MPGRRTASKRPTKPARVSPRKGAGLIEAGQAYSLEKFMEVLGCNWPRVRDMKRRGLMIRKDGGRVMIRGSDYLEYLGTLETKPVSTPDQSSPAATRSIVDPPPSVGKNVVSDRRANRPAIPSKKLKNRSRNTSAMGVIQRGVVYPLYVFCQRLGITRFAIHDMRKRGLKVKKDGRFSVILGDDYVEYVRSLPTVEEKRASQNNG